MPKFNTVLVRWQKAHAYVTRAPKGSQRETYLELQGVTQRNEALSFANSFLNSLADERETNVVRGPALRNEQIPGPLYQLGDSLSIAPGVAERIQSLTIAQEVDDPVIVTPELQDPLSIAEAALARRVQRISQGLQGEWGTPAVRQLEYGSSSPTSPPPFSLSGPISEARVSGPLGAVSPPWICPGPYSLAWIEWALGTASTNSIPTAIVVFQPTGGVIERLVTMTIPPGQTRIVRAVPMQIMTNYVVRMLVGAPSASPLAEDLTITLRGTPVAVNS